MYFWNNGLRSSAAISCIASTAPRDLPAIAFCRSAYSAGSTWLAVSLFCTPDSATSPRATSSVTCTSGTLAVTPSSLTSWLIVAACGVTSLLTLICSAFSVPSHNTEPFLPLIAVSVPVLVPSVTTSPIATGAACGVMTGSTAVDSAVTTAAGASVTAGASSRFTVSAARDSGPIGCSAVGSVGLMVIAGPLPPGKVSTIAVAISFGCCSASHCGTASSPGLCP